MKICIWCQKNEAQVTFQKRAHTIPKSLGGVNLCENVCDECNHYFGSPQPNLPAPELVLKEILNISKYFLLENTDKRKRRYKSEYFNVQWQQKTFKLKPRYKLKVGFQEKIGRQFRRAMYKVYLEERERVKGDALSIRFNFIREFARYNQRDYNIYTQYPKISAIFSNTDDLLSPEFRFNEHIDKLDKEFRVYPIPLMGHNFVIPTSPLFDTLNKKLYLNYLLRTDSPMKNILKPIIYAEDVDYLFENVLK